MSDLKAKLAELTKLLDSYEANHGEDAVVRFGRDLVASMSGGLHRNAVPWASSSNEDAALLAEMVLEFLERHRDA